MRKPNGYGSVVNLGKGRRLSYAIRKTVTYNSNGTQKYKYISYHKTKMEAEEALMNYNQNPFNVDTQKITFKDIFEKWSKQKYQHIKKNQQNAYNAAYKVFETLYDVPFYQLKTLHFQEIFLNCGKGHGTRRKMKNLINQMYEYAMINDIVTKDYAKYVKIGEKEGGKTAKIFTDEEILLLWKHKNNQFVDIILILIYTGFRIQELLNIKNSDIDLENWLMIGGSKTEAGKNRIVPIHSKIKNLIMDRMEKNLHSEYFVYNNKNEQMKYSNFKREKFDFIMSQLNMKHNIHDTRHTFVTLLSKAGADETSIIKIVGHSSFKLSQDIYIHKNLEDKRKAIELIDKAN